jgi:hypothetical protein
VSQLPVPPAVAKASSSAEILRVWVADGQQHVSLASGIWSDPAAWGLLLVDLARHISRAYEQSEGRSADEVLARLREGFDAEWSSPTDEPSGGPLR